MATNFPSSLDSLTNPQSSDGLNNPSHSAQHADANDAIEALQAKVGIDSSAVTTSHDYKIAQLEARPSTSVGDTPPSSPSSGNLWWDSSTGRLKIYYNDGDSSQWVDAYTSFISGGSGGGTPEPPEPIVWDSDQNILASQIFS